MNSKQLSVACILGGSAILSGCAAPRTPPEATLNSAEPFEEYDLSLSGKNHSAAMQYVHLMSRARVYSANDLDANMDGYTNVGVRATQATAAAGVLIGSLNPFQAAFSMIGQQSNLSKLDWFYTKNTLIIISPLPSLKVDDVAMVLKESRGKLVDIISEAYRKDGASVTVIKSTVDANWSTSDRAYVIPQDDTGGVVDCYHPNVLKNINAAVAAGGFELSYRLPANSLGVCFSYIDPYANVYTSNGSNGEGLPAGNFLVSSATLPALFPIDKLSSNQSGVYLYQPSLAFMSDANLRDYAKNDKIDDISKYFKEEGLLRLTPMVTDLSNGELLEFGF